MTPRTEAGLTPATGEAFQPVITSEKGREEGFIKEEKKKKNPQIICLFHLLFCSVNTKQGLSQAEGWHTRGEHYKGISQPPSSTEETTFSSP